MKLSILITLLIYFQVDCLAMESMRPINMAKKVKFEIEDDVIISADYYTGKKGSAGVLLLHGCASDSSADVSLSNALYSQGIHALSVNLRGFGESSSAMFSQEDIKRRSRSLVEYQQDMAILTSFWDDDLLAAYQFLKVKIGIKQKIAIVASGCSSIFAVKLANKVKVSNLVLIEPEMSSADIEYFKHLFDTPVYFINIGSNTSSSQTSQELFAWNNSKHSKLVILKALKGSILHSQQLNEDIASWLQYNFKQ